MNSNKFANFSNYPNNYSNNNVNWQGNSNQSSITHASGAATCGQPTASHESHDMDSMEWESTSIQVPSSGHQQAHLTEYSGPQYSPTPAETYVAQYTQQIGFQPPHQPIYNPTVRRAPGQVLSVLSNIPHFDRVPCDPSSQFFTAGPPATQDSVESPIQQHAFPKLDDNVVLPRRNFESALSGPMQLSFFGRDSDHGNSALYRPLPPVKGAELSQFSHRPKLHSNASPLDSNIDGSITRLSAPNQIPEAALDWPGFAYDFWNAERVLVQKEGADISSSAPSHHPSAKRRMETEHNGKSTITKIHQMELIQDSRLRAAKSSGDRPNEEEENAAGIYYREHRFHHLFTREPAVT